jgi:hypothetical protein
MIYLTPERDGRRAQPFLKNITLSRQGNGAYRLINGNLLSVEISLLVQRG